MGEISPDVMVFDLDDTLYFERDYQRSGLEYLAEIVEDLYGVNFLFYVKESMGASDILKTALESASLPIWLLPHLIAIYRYHRPKIEVCSGVIELLEKFQKKDIPMYIITDGRAVTQRLKLQALGIAKYFEYVYISEEVGKEKPAKAAYLSVEARHPGKLLMYVGDNPKKDFISPRELGWMSLGVKHQPNRIHSLEGGVEPTQWVESISDLDEILC